LYDYNINKIADDDDGGEGYNAFISIELEAGETYFLVAGFFQEEYLENPVTYKLNIKRV